MIDLFQISSCVTVPLLLWFSTGALLEYSRLFNLEGLFKVDEYLEFVTNGYDKDYKDFLLEHYNCFFVRLLHCPICTGVWLGFLTGATDAALTISLTAQPYPYLILLEMFVKASFSAICGGLLLFFTIDLLYRRYGGNK